MSRLIPRSKGLALLAALLTVGCGGSSNPSPSTAASTPTPSAVPTATETPSATPSPSAQPITDAAAVRDQLLALAKPGTPMPLDSSSTGNAVSAWFSTYPSITFLPQGTPADSTSISGWHVFFSKSKGINVLPFAVSDASGTCAGGIIEADNSNPPVVTKAMPFAVPAGQPCSGQTVGTAAGYE